MKTRLAAFLGLLAVLLGAFGAHGLKGVLTAEGIEWWKTATQYLLPHAVLMLGIAHTEGRWPRATFWLFFVGATIFAGTLYLMAVTGVRILGAITPIGGACLVLGWASLLLGSWGRGSKSTVPEP